jgi:hypothetical protein
VVRGRRAAEGTDYEEVQEALGGWSAGER